VQLGGDPQAARAAARREMTFGELCDLYLAEGVAMKKPSTIRDDQRRIAVHLKPLLGSRPLSKVTSADVERLMADIAVGKTGVTRSPTVASYKAAVRAAKATGLPRPEKPELRTRTSAVARGGRGAATRAVGLLGGIFSFAMKRKLVAENPVRGVKRFADQQRQRYLSEVELVRLNAAMEAGERAGMNPKAVAVIKLLLVTGCRRREIENLRWSEVDLERGCLRLEDSKTGPRRVVLGGPAIEILTSITRTPSSAYVFPGRELTKPFGGVEMVWKTKLRAAAGLDGVRLHDLRHTFASLSVAAGHSLPMTGAMLGHRSTRTTAQYAHLADDPLREAADRTARAAIAAMAGSRQKAA
jgi:integrase